MQKIVILGAGFGGLRTALDLASYHLENSKIILVDKTPHHDFHADLYEVAGAYVQEKKNKKLLKLQFENVYGSVAVPLKKILHGKNIEFIQDEVLDLKPKERRIILKNRSGLDFDYLILALGSQTNFFNIPNLEKIAFSLKTVNDALNIRDTLDEIFYRKKKLKKINIVIGGGGFTGCELAAELSDFVRKLAFRHKHPEKLVEIAVVEACPQILNGTENAVWQKAQERLVRFGIMLILNSTIVNVSPKTLTLKNKKIIPFDILIWTAGVKSNPLVKKLLSAKFEKGGCIVVNQYLQILPFENIFGVGDNIYCFDGKNRCPVPQTATAAIAQGKTCALNIYRKIKGLPLAPYIPSLPKFVIPLGGKFAIADLGFICFSGFLGWLVRRLISLRYFLSILPPPEAFSTWFFGTWIFLKND